MRDLDASFVNEQVLHHAPFHDQLFDDCSGGLVVLESARETGAVDASQLAFAMPHSLRPLALVDVTVHMVRGAEAMTKAVLPVATVSRAVSHRGSAVAVALALGVVVALVVLHIALDAYKRLIRKHSSRSGTVP